MFKFKQRADVTRRSLWSLAINRIHCCLRSLVQDENRTLCDETVIHEININHTLLFFCWFAFLMNFPLYFPFSLFPKFTFSSFFISFRFSLFNYYNMWVFLVSRLLQNKHHIVSAVNMKSWRNVGLVDKFDRN